MGSERRQRGSPLIVAPSALRDLQELYDYIAHDNPEAADLISEQLWKGIWHVKSFPGSGHTRTDLAGKRQLRFWSVGRFLIVYRDTSTSIEIVAVLHGSRDIPAILHEREPDE